MATRRRRPRRSARARTSTLFVAEQLTKRLDLHGEGSLWLRLLEDDAAQPEVAMALDACVNMMEVSEAEKHSDQGLQEAVKRLQAICQVSMALGAITDRADPAAEDPGLSL